MSEKYISLNEVKRHNKRNSVWIVIHDIVYDVTSFLNEHPGGADALLDVAGTDSTQAFEDVGHSEDARVMLRKYKIGELPLSEKQEATCTSCYPHATNKRSSPSSKSRKSKRKRAPGSQSRDRSYKRGAPCAEPDNRWKYALLAVATAVVVGFALKKAMASQ